MRRRGRRDQEDEEARSVARVPDGHDREGPHGAGLADDAPLILYNLGRTYREAKDYEKAIRQYKLFLERGKPGEEVRALVECHIRTMTAEMEHAASTAPPSGPLAEPPGPATDDTP